MKILIPLALLLVLATPSVAQQAGEAEFGKRCARCHDTAAAVVFLKPHTDAPRGSSARPSSAIWNARSARRNKFSAG